MSITLDINNFQSIQHSSINLEGFTTIQGSSNRGKSAIVRALRTILYNEWHPSYLHKGTKKCTLSLTFDYNINNIKQIILTQPMNTYQVIHWDNITDSFYPKVGKSVPKEIRDMNFNLVITERDDKFNMNFQGQLETLFLVAERSEVLVTSLFNKIFDIARYEKALRSITSDSIKLNSQYNQKKVELEASETILKDNTTSLHTTQRKLNTTQSIYQLFLEKEQQILDLNQGIEQLNQSKLLAQEVKQNFLELETLSTLLKHLTLYITSYNKVNSIVFLENTIQDLSTNISRSRRDFSSLYNLNTNISTYLSKLKTICEQDTLFSTLSQTQQEISTLYEIKLKLNSLLTLLREQNSNINKIISFTDIIFINNELLSHKHILSQIKSISVCLNSQTKIIDQISLINEAIFFLHTSQAEFYELTFQINSTKQAQQAILDLISFYQEELKLCPFCNSTYDNSTYDNSTYDNSTYDNSTYDNSIQHTHKL